MDISFDKSPKALSIYVTLVGVFIAALVLTNLIAGRFFAIGSWTLSSGVIAYPVTFLVTDLISEIYGRKRADLAVKVGFVASVFVTIVLLIALQTQISQDSYVTEESFLNVFGLAPGIVFGDRCAPTSQLNLSMCVSMSFGRNSLEGDTYGCETMAQLYLVSFWILLLSL